MRKALACRHVQSQRNTSDQAMLKATLVWGDFHLNELIDIHNKQYQATLDNSLSDTITSFIAATSQQQQHMTPQQQTQPQQMMVDQDLLTKSTSMEELNQLLRELSTENLAGEIAKGNCLVNMGRYQEAILFFTSIIVSNPLIPSAYLGRGTSNAMLGNHEEALIDFTKVIELDNTLADAYKRRAQILVAHGMDYEALEDFNQAIVFDKERDTDIHYQRGLLYFQMRNYERALKDFRKVVEYDKTHKLAWNRIGLCLNIRGFPREAFDSFYKAIELDPHFEAAYTNIGQCWKELGDYQSSLATFSKALELTPNYSNALHLRGLLYFHSGKHLEAINDWSVYLCSEPDMIDVRQLRAISLNTIGRYREALADYEHILNINANHFSFYQREIALFTHHHLDTSLNSFNIDNELDPYLKTLLCQRQPASTLLARGYTKQNNLSDSIKEVDSEYKLTANEKTLVEFAKRIGKRLQYDCEGFLPNARQHLQCGLAALDIAQTLTPVWESLFEEAGSVVTRHQVGANQSSHSNQQHTFGWRDLFDVAAKWRQFSEPNDPVWWVDGLSKEQFAEGFGSHTPIITGQTNVVRYYPMFTPAFQNMKMLLPIQFPEQVKDQVLVDCNNASDCKDMYRIMKKDYYVVTPCLSTFRPGHLMEGTRLTLQYASPEGYEFAIRTPCTPQRWKDYDEEMTLAWNDLCSKVYQMIECAEEEADTKLVRLLGEISDAILRITFYWYNFMPLTRGSAAVGYTVLLGVFLSLGYEVDAPLPKNLQPDWEAILRPTPESFTKVINPWMYPALEQRSISNLPDVASTISTLRQLIQVLNSSSSDASTMNE
ncbi:hypothetical protein SAMD00019534_101390 [Acytostelium subglobosum LB1]|uniref:hypothetical protein n=1 Tax=Acytostelium subglobosum LB1 TaxID=1410327 RepID=UPI000644816A|nr:hypothetical protein SAMD00019534_101390 [Acytostelium subglobosum LB1]GAM26964.1 hypothetical protein SAMD00019534_101390 [Acytostelium subglobosum LB1]|eukprot:XP_012750232.1 hypothetical protein SAMD00019534_101390 [Acytostelium subglobosum LB1]